MWKQRITVLIATSALALLPVVASGEPERVPKSESKSAAEGQKRSKAPKSASSASEHLAKGTITAWDESSKQITLKTAGGAETIFAWTDKTELNGTPKVGEAARVEYTKGKDGKLWATEVSVGKPPKKDKA